MPRLRTALLLAGAIAPAAAAAQDPPTLECAVGFDGLKAAALALPGAQQIASEDFDTITQARPDAWRVDYFFTTSVHPAYPAVALRTRRKQVTGVWTAQSKVCGYGDPLQLTALADAMKAGDKALTDASRAEVERAKRAASPLAPGP